MVKLYWAWRKAQPEQQDEAEAEAAVENSAVITLEYAEEMAWKEIEEFLAQMPAYDFQELVAALLRAIELNPDYGVAHFNLALLYLDQKPPALELARRHYEKAVALGVEKDEIVERRLKE